MSKTLNNPYLASKQLWHDLYGSVETKLTRANRIILVLCLALAISTLVIGLMATQPRIQPYVAVLHGNEFLTLNKFESLEARAFKPKLASLLSREFIKKLRKVTLDPKVNQDNFIYALSMASGAATSIIKEYQKLKPTNITTLQITSLILLSSHRIEIRWQETQRDPSTGHKVKQQQFSAELSFQFARPSTNALIARHNPLGFYITNIAWSQDNVL